MLMMQVASMKRAIFQQCRDFLKSNWRELSTLEEHKVQWLSEWEYETVYVLFNLIKEIAYK
ncbi:hypothetical protein ACGTN9_17425 [Halobacillus sp. MO56]